MSGFLQDYRGNSSFTRLITLLLVLAALAALYGAARWDSDRYLHGFDKLLDTAAAIFLSGKGPEIVEAAKQSVTGWVAKIRAKGPEDTKEAGTP